MKELALAGERFETTKPKNPPDQAEQHSNGWLSDNVIDPFIHGTGVVQVYNTFASDKGQIKLPETHQAKTFTTDWAVQTVSGAAGAIVPYVIAGKFMGAGMRRIGTELGLQGGAARFMANESAAQILGAGAYDFIKAPNQGETRLGNAIGTMASFGVFEGGNKLVANAIPTGTTQLARIGLTGLGRVGVGAAGGVVGYDVSNEASSLLTGSENHANWEGRLNAAASGALINTALPAMQNSFSKVADFAINKRPWGNGVPIDRYMRQGDLASDGDLKNLAYENPLARVKEVTGTDKPGSTADTRNNIVVFNANDGIGKLAHELTHLRLARQYEGGFKQVADNLKGDPAKAEQQYMQIRAEMESQSRQAEIRVHTRQTGVAPDVVTDVRQLGTETASNGKTYNEIWNKEFAQFKNDPTFRPAIEYSGAEVKAEKPAQPKPDMTATDSPGSLVPIDKAVFGSPDQLGATITDKGVNFAVDSHGASNMDLLLFNASDAKEPSQVLPMFKTGDVWHREVPGLKAGDFYLFKAHGDYSPAQDGTRFNSVKALLDPYGKAVTGDMHPTGKGEELGYDNTNPADTSSQLRPSTVDNTAIMPKNVVIDTKNFNWENDKPLETPMSDSVIYELNLRGFTAGDTNIAPQLRGTYRGLIEKIPYLRDLGVTAVELMPVMKFHAEDSTRTNPETGEKLQNAWGYNTMSYQAPEGRFAADGMNGQQVNEFKSMVKALHDNNVEVILDVVFNHTAEGKEVGPTFSFRGLDNNQYYLLMPNRPDLYFDITGCGNTLNANNPKVQKLILDTLKYWHEDYHVDGFRFDLATAFNLDANGQFKEKTPIMEAIENDPEFAKVKFIAEPWDIVHYRLGHFSDRMWAEWNGNFRDTARDFVRGAEGQTGILADRIAGSPGWFPAEKGRNSVNFITAHDGFTLRDVVSYNEKHNQANGENNNDGNNDNKSWNSGYEGSVKDANIPEWQKAQIEQLRDRQAKNLMALMLLSRGTPMILMGDEIRRSQYGNNNAYNQLRLNEMRWDELQQNADMHRYTKMFVDLRKQHQIGRTAPSDISWHGVEPFKPDFSNGARFIAWQTTPKVDGVRPLYQAFNAYWEPIKVQLPPGKWARLVDTNLPTGQDIVTSANATPLDREYIIQPRSGIVLEGQDK